MVDTYRNIQHWASNKPNRKPNQFQKAKREKVQGQDKSNERSASTTMINLRVISIVAKVPKTVYSLG